MKKYISCHDFAVVKFFYKASLLTDNQYVLKQFSMYVSKYSKLTVMIFYC